MASVVAITRLGEKMEVGLFGPEACRVFLVIHGLDRSPLHTFIQVAESTLRLPPKISARR